MLLYMSEESDIKPLKKTARLELLKKQLADLENEEEEEPEIDNEPIVLEKPKKEKPPKTDNRKKEKTEKQKEQFEKMRKARDAKIAESKKLRAQIEKKEREAPILSFFTCENEAFAHTPSLVAHPQLCILVLDEELERKIVEKAIKVKKKQIKKQQVLDEISSDEEIIVKKKDKPTIKKVDNITVKFIPFM